MRYLLDLLAHKIEPARIPDDLPQVEHHHRAHLQLIDDVRLLDSGQGHDHPAGGSTGFLVAVLEQVAGHDQRRELDHDLDQILELKDRRHDVAFREQFPQAVVLVGDGTRPGLGHGIQLRLRRMLAQRLALNDDLLGELRRVFVGQGDSPLALAQSLDRQHQVAPLFLGRTEIGQVLAGQGQELIAQPAAADKFIGEAFLFQSRQPLAQFVECCDQHVPFRSM